MLIAPRQALDRQAVQFEKETRAQLNEHRAETDRLLMEFEKAFAPPAICMHPAQTCPSHSALQTKMELNEEWEQRTASMKKQLAEVQRCMSTGVRMQLPRLSTARCTSMEDDDFFFK